MRSLLLLVVVALCFLCGASAVDVPHKSCAGAHDDVNLTSIVSAVWPPVKGSMLSLNITGDNSKLITSGSYTINIRVNGIPLPDVTGDIKDFKALPWPVGDLNFSYSQDIPSIAPSGQYAIKISAVDQDKTEIFCITLTFSLSLSKAEEATEATEVSVAKARADIHTVNRASKIGLKPRFRRGNRV